jgi:hypothetical protein
LKDKTTFTAAQEISLAAAELADRGKEEFSEWDLSVAVWQRNKNRFGCRGYEDKYPDHKRVMSEIMGQTKKDNPLRRGWMEKTKPNHYRVTPLGRAEAERLRKAKGEIREATRSAQAIYDSIEPYIKHRVFKSYLRDSDEPRMWLGAAAFLGLTSNEPTHLEDRLRTVDRAIKVTRAWMDESGQDEVRRGVTGGGIAVHRTDVERLAKFVEVLKERFQVQFDAIRKSANHSKQ